MSKHNADHFLRMHQKHQDTQGILRKHYLDCLPQPSDGPQQNETQLIDWLRKIVKEHLKYAKGLTPQWEQ